MSSAPSNHLKDIACAMWRFRADGFLCDTVLYADDGLQTRAHSVVLAAASPIFRDALGIDGTQPAAPRTEPHMIQLPGCDLGTLELALSVIYTGALENSEACSADVLQKVFLLLQQLGVEIEKIDGCSVTYVERTMTGNAESKSVSGFIVRDALRDGIKVESADDSTDSDVDEISVNENIKPRVVEPEQTGDEHEGSRIVDESGVEIEEVGATAAVYGDRVQSEVPGEFYVILRNKEHEDEDEDEELGEECEDDGHTEGIEEEDMEADGIANDIDVKHVNCPTCGKAFSKINYLQTHMRTHTSQKPFECDRCGRGFSQRANLHRHYQGHLGERPHLCHLCAKSFIQKVQLSEHLAVAHAVVVTIGKCYMCRVCQQSFAERGHLRQHAVKAHPEAHREAVGAITEADKSHVCDTCGRGYTTLGALRMHMRVHTGDLMACNMCDKAYVNRALLEQHLRTHTREKAFECKQCGKAFIYKNALTVHMRTHTGEKPYVCPICHNSYSQFGHLQSHKKTHTGERPYTCDTCGKAYRQRVDLRLHLKRVHHTAGDIKPVVKLVMD